MVTFVRIATGIFLACLAIYSVDSKEAGTLFGLSVALIFRVHRPTLWNSLGASGVIFVVVTTFAMMDLRIVQSFWPSEHGTSVASVMVIGQPGRSARRGDVMAWRLTDSASPIVAIDRILALPGETLIIDNERIRLSNGQQSESPIAGVRSNWFWSISPNAGEFGVIPSTVAWRPAGQDPLEAESQAVAKASLVSEHQVVGRAVLVRHGWGPWKPP